MHNRENMDYADFISDLLNDLRESAETALRAGIPAEKIILDPGIGFAKTYEMNLKAINRLDMIAELGYPILLGVSRKSLVGKALGLPVDERLEGSLAGAVIGFMRGCSFLRVHDVKEAVQAIQLYNQIRQS
jgi:dihydropteroate synthase